MRFPWHGGVHQAYLGTVAAMVVAFSGLATADVEGHTGIDQPDKIDQVSIGRDIYREGKLPSGDAIVGSSLGDIPVSGSLVACENCHRRSGLGSSEGGKVVPPVTAQALLSDRTHDQRSAFRSRSLRSTERPAYDAEYLARALRLGVDSAGRTLDPLMPRYELTDSHVEALIAYLRTLVFENIPGLTETEIHFATIVARNSDETDRQSMLEVLKRFFKDKNANTRNESGRASRGAYYRDFMEDSYRAWVLHVWELDGASDTWRKQLEKLYADEPVFALVGGIGEGSWRPVHEFCENNGVPCIFPITDQPVGDEDFYSIYLSVGLRQEARALAEELKSVWESVSGSECGGPGTERSPRLEKADVPLIVPVYRRGSEGEAMAKAVSDGLEGSEWPTEVHAVESAGPPPTQFWRSLYAERPGSILFVWLSARDLVSFKQAIPVPGAPDRPQMVVVSETITGPDAFRVTGALIPQTRVVSKFELLDGRNRSLERLRAWLRPRGIELKRERIQADSYLAVTLTSSAVRHMRRNFSREYMIEIIEHGLDNSVFRSVYPRLSLGPNQRFASKEIYILRTIDCDPEKWISVDDVSAH